MFVWESGFCNRVTVKQSVLSKIFLHVMSLEPSIVSISRFSCMAKARFVLAWIFAASLNLNLLLRRLCRS